MVSLYSSDFVGGNLVFQPDSFQDTRTNPIVKCMVNGTIRLLGDALFIETREPEFDDEYDNGMELRDYAMLGIGRKGKTYHVTASILVSTTHPHRHHLRVHDANWRIKTSYPAVS